MACRGFGLTLPIALSLGACAAPARDIEAAAVDGLLYERTACADLSAKRAQLARDYVFASLKQNQVSFDDRVRTLGVPTLFGTVFDGSNAEEVGRLKGELYAIKKGMSGSGCLPAK